MPKDPWAKLTSYSVQEIRQASVEQLRGFVENYSGSAFASGISYDAETLSKFTALCETAAEKLGPEVVIALLESNMQSTASDYFYRIIQALVEKYPRFTQQLNAMVEANFRKFFAGPSSLQDIFSASYFRLMSQYYPALKPAFTTIAQAYGSPWGKRYAGYDVVIPLPDPNMVYLPQPGNTYGWRNFNLEHSLRDNNYFNPQVNPAERLRILHLMADLFSENLPEIIPEEQLYPADRAYIQLVLKSFPLHVLYYGEQYRATDFDKTQLRQSHPVLFWLRSPAAAAYLAWVEEQ